MKKNSGNNVPGSIAAMRLRSRRGGTLVHSDYILSFSIKEGGQLPMSGHKDRLV